MLEKGAFKVAFWQNWPVGLYEHLHIP